MKRLPVFIFFALVTLSGASEGASRLHFAAAIGDTRAIESLLAAGADVNAKESDGYTPLHVAVRFDFSGVFVHVIEALVAAGSNVAIRNNAGGTPLDLAYKKKSKAAVIAALQAAAR